MSYIVITVPVVLDVWIRRGNAIEQKSVDVETLKLCVLNNAIGHTEEYEPFSLELCRAILLHQVPFAECMFRQFYRPDYIGEETEFAPYYVHLHDNDPDPRFVIAFTSDADVRRHIHDRWMGLSHWVVPQLVAAIRLVYQTSGSISGVWNALHRTLADELAEQIADVEGWEDDVAGEDEENGEEDEEEESDEEDDESEEEETPENDHDLP